MATCVVVIMVCFFNLFIFLARGPFSMVNVDQLSNSQLFTVTIFFVFEGYTIVIDLVRK